MFRFDEIEYERDGTRARIATLDSPESSITILIGQNGMGKSSLLREIAAGFRDGVIEYGARQNPRMKVIKLSFSRDDALGSILTREKGSKSSLSTKQSQEHGFKSLDAAGPSRVICLSFTSFDKFPRDGRWQNQDSGGADYIYIGPNGEYGRSSYYGMLYKAIDLLADSYFDPECQVLPVRDTFDLLRLQPEIRVVYDIVDRNLLKKIFAAASLIDTGSPDDTVFDFILRDSENDRWVKQNRVDRKKINASRIGKRLLAAVDIARTLREEDFVEERQVSFVFNFSGRAQSTELEQTYAFLNVLREIRAAHFREISVRKTEGLHLDWYDVREASSGELNFISGMLGLSAALTPNSLVLIDEPENSLHPEWQREYVKILSAVLKHRPGSCCLVATHSPIIVPQISHFNKRGVLVYRLDDGLRQLPDLIEDSADAVLLQQFGYASDGNYLIKNVLAQAVEAKARAISSPELYQKMRDKLLKLGVPKEHPYFPLIQAVVGEREKNKGEDLDVLPD